VCDDASQHLKGRGLTRGDLANHISRFRLTSERCANGFQSLYVAMPESPKKCLQQRFAGGVAGVRKVRSREIVTKRAETGWHAGSVTGCRGFGLRSGQGTVLLSQQSHLTAQLEQLSRGLV